jgi:hypothetical protein
MSRVLSLAAFGPPVCDHPRLIRFMFENTRQGNWPKCHLFAYDVLIMNNLSFTVMFATRSIPSALQPLLVWALPHKWRLRSTMKELESFTVPLVDKYKNMIRNEEEVPANIIASMLAEAKQDVEKDPYVLTQLLAALAAGGSYSPANFIVSVIFDLVAHPHFFERDQRRI